MNEKKELKVEEIKAAAQARGCPVQQALYYVSGFLDGPMCGKCFPCSMGSYEARNRLRSLAEGNGTQADLDALKLIAEKMQLASFCKKGKDTGRFIADWMAAGVYDEHIKGRCPEKECKGLVEFSIDPEKCTNCGLCRDACKHGAIFGEKRKPYLTAYLPYEIRQARCIKCGECLEACPEGAILIIDKAAAMVKA